VHDEPTYHILPTATGWQVILDSEVLKAFSDQPAAMRYVKRVAHMAGDARVIVHAHADDFGEEISLHRSSDGTVESIYQIPQPR
jgi:hypothetical protein